MSTDLWRLAIAIAVVSHGIGHSLFMPLPFDKYPTNGHSWLLSGLLGETAIKAVAYLVAAVAMVFFDGLPPVNAIAALAFNVAVIAAIQLNWPSAEILGIQRQLRGADHCHPLALARCTNARRCPTDRA